MADSNDSAGVAAPAVKFPQHPKKRWTTSWLRGISRFNLAILLLSYLTAVHLIGLFVFTKGFLLTRLSIPAASPPYSLDHPAPLAATHSKAVIIIIDALRTDFISPHFPSPKSPYHHDVLTLPAELAASQPSHSLIFNAFSDPPTTTMQRIKGLTTGSLPTFVDAGANFASTAIEEDSIISQLVAAGKKLAFMGDDTWDNLFPTSFELSHPYDSFNVEDLHTVDNGVIEHMFPYLDSVNSSRWDVMIGHFLGVDHVGHRVGPEREVMRTKLTQMDEVLRRVVDALDDDTLLVLLGDHGMDPKGNHGGDSELETASAMWLYSKGKPLRGELDSDDIAKLASAWPTYTFPGSQTPIRHINQIDLVPTLALLLGVPIPFNNLGTAIPECFSQSLDRLEVATRVNAEQVERYVEEYGNTKVLDAMRLAREKAHAGASLIERYSKTGKIEHAGKAAPSPSTAGRVADWFRSGSGSSETVGDSATESPELVAAQHHSITQNRHVTAVALTELRALWAQFSLPYILLGLLVLALSLLSTVALYVGVRNNSTAWDVYVRLALETAIVPSIALGSVAGTVAGAMTREPLIALQTFAVAAALVSECVLFLPILAAAPTMPSLFSPSSWQIKRAIGPILLVFHAVSFASNSFIMWEDRMVVFLFVTIPIVHLVKALTAPTATMRLRIIGFSLAIVTIVRLVGTITICREEQQPYCRVTFYGGSSPVAPQWALWCAVPVALAIFPRVVAIVLSLSKSYSGPARPFIGAAWRGIIVANSVYWVLEFVESWDRLQPERIPLVRLAKLWLARASAGATLGALPYLWATGGLAIEVTRDPDQTGDTQAVTVFGFANAYGSSYLLFLLIPFALTHLVSQHVSQITLSAIVSVILLYLELVDTQRDAIIMVRSFSSSANPGAFESGGAEMSTTLVRPRFTDVVPLVLLGLLGFFATGHQAVLTSIQWKAAFVGFEVVTYPWSPLLVILNTWGPVALSAIAIPLLALWNVSPRPRSTLPLLAHSLQLALAYITYHVAITLASAVCAAWLRRHLMVWKVFAPRFMLAGCTLLIVDLAIVFAIGVGLRMTSWKVWRTFKTESI